MDLLGASAALSLETSPLLLFAVYFAARARRSARMHQGVAAEWPPARFHVAGSSVREARSHCAFPGTSELSERCSSFREMKLETFSPCYLISLPPVSSSRFLWSLPLLLEFSRLGSVNPDRTWKVPSVAGGSSASPGAWGNSSLRAGGLPGRRARTRWRSRARLRPQRPPRRLFISASSV